MTRTSRFLLSTTTTTVLNSSSSTGTAVAEPPEEAVSVESDFVVILAALLCALICVVGLIMVARCAWLRRAGSTATATRTSGHHSSAANKGIKRKFIEALPKFTYDSSKDEEGEKGGKPSDVVDCAICLAEYADGDEIRVLPQCGHRFHVGCIDTWLGSHSSCPSCREILVITRCRKCGEFPTVSAGEIPPPATELKGRQTVATTSSSSNEFLP